MSAGFSKSLKYPGRLSAPVLQQVQQLLDAGKLGEVLAGVTLSSTMCAATRPCTST